MLLKDNHKLTIVSITEFTGATYIREIITTRQVEGRQAYRVRRGHKEYFLKLDNNTLVYDGWGQPFGVNDTPYGHIHLECFNFNSMEYISRKNMNELFDNWENVRYSPAKQ